MFLNHRRGSCTVVQPEEMLAMETLDATRHRFGLDHLEKLDRIDDDDDDVGTDDDDVFTAEEDTYNRRRFGGGGSRHQDDGGVTTDESVVSSSRHAESLGSNSSKNGFERLTIHPSPETQSFTSMSAKTKKNQS